MTDISSHRYPETTNHNRSAGRVRFRKRGISTIIGSIIFIGILLSAIIPMYLVMKQADTMYFQKQSEMLMKDQDKLMEQIEFIRTVPWNNRFFNVTIKNNGQKLLNITYTGTYNVAENPAYSPVKQITAVGSQQNITVPKEFSYDIKNNVQAGTYVMELITDKGNTFVTKYPDNHPNNNGEYGAFNATVTKIIGDFIPDYHTFSWAVRPSLETSGFNWQKNWNLPGTTDVDDPQYIIAKMNM